MLLAAFDSYLDPKLEEGVLSCNEEGESVVDLRRIAYTSFDFSLRVNFLTTNTL